MPPLLLGILAYVLVQFAIGIAVSRRVATEDDFFVAGRKLGPLLATATIFATWFGAETCLGAAGEVYESGLSATQAEPFAYGLCLIVAGLVFALPLWRRKLVTIADLLEQRFAPSVARLAALLMIPTSLLWAAAQIRGFGQVLSSASEMETTAATTLAAALVIGYTASGGMMADVVTDLVQGIALIVGLVVVFFAVTSDLGGVGEAARSIDPDRMGFALAPGTSWLDVLETWSIPILGSIVAQELVARISASRSGEVARRSAVLGGILYVAIGAIPIFLGLVGAGLLPELADTEQVLPALALNHVSPFVYVLFAGALVSAILSTVDSNLLVCSSLLVHNLVLPLRPGLAERSKVRAARAGVVLFGLIAYGLALGSDGVGKLVELASGFGSSGILVVVVFGLFTRFGSRASALAALVAGVAVYTLGLYAGWRTPYLASLAAALAGYAVFALVRFDPTARAARARHSTFDPC